MQGWPPEMQKPFLLSFVRPTCKKAGRHAGLARDAKKIVASRTANLSCRPSYSTVLLFYYFTPDTVPPLPMFGVGRPRCKKVSTYYHVLQQNVGFASRTASQPCMSALLFYCFTILLLLFYFFTPRPRYKKRFCISDGQPCMSALLFCCFTVLLFYYFTPDTVLPRPMFGVGRPRCKKVFHVLPRTTAERIFCISDGQPCMSALLFYCFTTLLFTISLQIQYCRGRCLGLATRDAKKFSTYYHAPPRTATYYSRT